MTVDVAKFRTDFPEFTDPVVYPDPQVQFYIDVFVGAFKGSRWGTGVLSDYGTELFVAHNLALEMQAKQLAAQGQNPGQVLGPIASGSVDKVAYSRSLVGILDPKAGHWNLTQYGLRYYRIMNMVGAGPVQVAPGADCGAVYPWAGPFFPPNYP